ncbi:exonuclease [Klebsiella phage Kpn74]|uniref:Exonuclease n=1 Tax=Klebsiella phage Kpn74 TaxID=3044026 RepID=A0AAT9V597_9CAUD|nr:exonuclease [Klebsiella phage Kpn74]
MAETLSGNKRGCDRGRIGIVYLPESRKVPTPSRTFQQKIWE